MSVLTSVSVSMIRSSPIFSCSEFQRISRRIFWLVCSDQESAVSALALCFQQSLLGFSGISTLSSIESVSLVRRNMARKQACFVNIFLS